MFAPNLSSWEGSVAPRSIFPGTSDHLADQKDQMKSFVDRSGEGSLNFQLNVFVCLGFGALSFIRQFQLAVLTFGFGVF